MIAWNVFDFLLLKRADSYLILVFSDFSTSKYKVIKWRQVWRKELGDEWGRTNRYFFKHEGAHLWHETDWGGFSSRNSIVELPTTSLCWSLLGWVLISLSCMRRELDLWQVSEDVYFERGVFRLFIITKMSFVLNIRLLTSNFMLFGFQFYCWASEIC